MSIAQAISELSADPPPQDVTDELAALSASLDVAIPAKELDRNLLIGTWNIRAFGDIADKWHAGEDDSPKRDLRAVACIAEIVSHFDVVAIQEVKGNIKGLRRMLKALGPEWGFILTDTTRGSAGNDERLAFVYDTRRVKPSGLACELVVPEEHKDKISEGTLQKQFARTPYAVSFQSGGQTFILITLHVLWGKDEGERTPELKAIAEWLGSWAEQVAEWDQNLFLLGDFNIDRKDDPNFQAFTSTGLHVPPEHQNLPRTIFDTPATSLFYDQIAWFEDKLTLTYSGTAGNFDFEPLTFAELDEQKKSWRMSDHYPLWAEFLMQPEPHPSTRRFTRA